MTKTIITPSFQQLPTKPKNISTTKKIIYVPIPPSNNLTIKEAMQLSPPTAASL